MKLALSSLSPPFAPQQSTKAQKSTASTSTIFLFIFQLIERDADLSVMSENLILFRIFRTVRIGCPLSPSHLWPNMTLFSIQAENDRLNSNATKSTLVSIQYFIIVLWTKLEFWIIRSCLQGMYDLFMSLLFCNALSIAIVALWRNFNLKMTEVK